MIFFIEMGQFWCENRGLGQGHILGYDITDLERYNFRQKSIFRRKHHSEDKIEELKIKVRTGFIIIRRI